MDSTTGIHLVDAEGFDVPTGEKDLPPFDSTDPANWPRSYEIDCVHSEISDPAERAELERLAIEAETDRRDAVDPEPFEPSPADWEDYSRWSEDLDRQR